MMVPDYFNSPPSQFPPDDPMADRDSLREHQFFFPTYDQASSSSYPVFFPHQTEPCRFQMHQDHQPQQVEDANHQAQYTGSQGLANHEIKPSKGLKITLWKKSQKSDDRQNPVKWMSSKMRMMQKMKNKSAEDEDNYHHQKQTASNSPQESTDHHFSSSNSSSNNSTTPFRVCSDCNTTKTPLWRSGPKGPKSLCNACGIRQRKARRAMASAAAAAAAADDAGPQTEAKSATAAVLKIKVQSKERVKNNGVQINTTPFKKRCTKMICGASSAEPSSHAQQKSSVFEDFLINLSKNLAFHHVFPQDEKEAAILLMAISSGLVHG